MKRMILMLEQDEDDRYITQEYFRNIEDVELNIMTSSEDVYTYLRGCLQKNHPCPSLLLLNYDSTPQNAVEMLSWIKAEKTLSHIPVIVLSGTAIPGIVRECYANGASSFIKKPALMAETDNKIQSFLNYWFKSVVLP